MDNVKKIIPVDMSDRATATEFKNIVESGIKIKIESFGIERMFMENYVRWNIVFSKDDKIIEQSLLGGMVDIKKTILNMMWKARNNMWVEIKK